MSGLTGVSLSLGFKQDRWGKRAPEVTTGFSGRWFACASASLAVAAALTAGERAVGGGHPSWPQVKGPDGLLLMDVVWRSQSQASRCGCLWHTRNMHGADLLALSGV